MFKANFMMPVTQISLCRACNVGHIGYCIESHNALFDRGRTQVVPLVLCHNTIIYSVVLRMGRALHRSGDTACIV